MRQKWTAFAVAALLILGLSGCGSASNRTVENNWPRTYAVQPDGETGNYDGSGSDGSGYNGGSGNSRSNSGSSYNGNNGLGGGLDGALDRAGDTLTGRSSASYEDMLRNGRVHDSDGYLMDGENSYS